MHGFIRTRSKVHLVYAICTLEIKAWQMLPLRALLKGEVDMHLHHE